MTMRRDLPSGLHGRLVAMLVATLALGITACGSGDLTLNEADPDVVAQSPTWDHVYPIFQRECIPCHTGVGGDDDEDEDEEGRAMPDLAGAAGGVEPGLESCQAILDNLEDIELDIFVDNNMPPGAWPRLTSEEKLVIRRWIDAGAEGPCN